MAFAHWLIEIILHLWENKNRRYLLARQLLEAACSGPGSNFNLPGDKMPRRDRHRVNRFTRDAVACLIAETDSCEMILAMLVLGQC